MTKHRFYWAWVTVKPVGSAKSCRPKVNSGYKDATPANGSEERTDEMLRAMGCCDGYASKAITIIMFSCRCGFLLYRAIVGDGILTFCLEYLEYLMSPVLAEETWLCYML
ncbi:hypothetical protein PIB30_022088 [Stylosanthes scabra]|uniref:Uncharacterized protein n=1 Tax=Stylosanthes scabra TaxID=79078 RepID=A0ABU6R9J4_9FABA|nr:hypothetical protein [Stylosanthes scabra]